MQFLLTSQLRLQRVWPMYIVKYKILNIANYLLIFFVGLLLVSSPCNMKESLFYGVYWHTLVLTATERLGEYPSLHEILYYLTDLLPTTRYCNILWHSSPNINYEWDLVNYCSSSSDITQFILCFKLCNITYVTMLWLHRPYSLF